MNNGTGRLTKICHGSTRVLNRKSSTADLTAWRDSIHKMNKSMNALVHLKTPPLHGNEAKATPQPLQDVALCVKDNICTLDMPTTCSSAMLCHFKCPFDATVVRLLKQAGADIVGKTNCDEFGMGSLNKHSIHGPVVNPFQALSEKVPWVDRERRSAGGSSGGSAAAVATGLCYAALATDTGGSTRLPASYCGIVGLKPSYGLISRWGVVSFADSLDCVGVMAQDVRSTKRVFDVLCVYDEKDPTAARPETRQTAFQSCQTRLSEWKMEQGNLTGLRIGVPQEYFPSELDPSALAPIRHVLQNLKAQGACLVPVSLPSTSYALSTYYVISSAEASSNLARYDGVQYGAQEEIPPGADRTKTAKVYAHTRSAKLGSEVQKRILLGTYALTADAFDNYFIQSQRVRNVIRDDFNRIFHVSSVLSSSHRTPSSTRPAGVDVLIHPSAIRTAPKLSESNDGLDAYVQDVLTVPASLAGLPALSVPAGFGEDGWPVGVSVVGQWGCEEMVLKVGEIIEEF